jgi:hypothetical protein
LSSSHGCENVLATIFHISSIRLQGRQWLLGRMKTRGMVMFSFGIASFEVFTFLLLTLLTFHDVSLFFCLCCKDLNSKLWLLVFKTLDLRGTLNNFFKSSSSHTMLPPVYAFDFLLLLWFLNMHAVAYYNCSFLSFFFSTF